MIKLLKVKIIKNVVKLFLALTFLVSLTTGVNAANPMRIAYITPSFDISDAAKDISDQEIEEVMNILDEVEEDQFTLKEKLR